MSYEKIAETLDMDLELDRGIPENLPELIPEDDVSIFDPAEETDSDVLLATSTVKDTMAKLSNVFDELHGLASAGENPKSYDVLNSIAGNINQLASTLVKIKRYKSKQDIGNSPQNITTNNTLIMSSMELIKTIRNEESQKELKAIED